VHVASPLRSCIPAAGSDAANIVSSKQPQYIPYQCVIGSDTLMNLAFDKADMAHRDAPGCRISTAADQTQYNPDVASN